MAVIARLEETAPAHEGLRERFEAALRDNGLNPKAFDDGIDHLMAALDRREPLSLADLEGTPLARVVERYVVAAGDEVSAAIYLYPPAGEWRRGVSPALAEVIARPPGSGPRRPECDLSRASSHRLG